GPAARSCTRAPPRQQREGSLRLSNRMRNLALLGVVRPCALHRERTGRQRHIRHLVSPRADPGARISVLLTGNRVGPAARRELIGERLGVLVAGHDREAIQYTLGSAVDEIDATAATGIAYVRQ